MILKLLLYSLIFCLGGAVSTLFYEIPECPVCEIPDCPSCPICEFEENIPQLDIEIKDTDINKQESVYDQYKVGFDYFN